MCTFLAPPPREIQRTPRLVSSSPPLQSYGDGKCASTCPSRTINILATWFGRRICSRGAWPRLPIQSGLHRAMDKFLGTAASKLFVYSERGERNTASATPHTPSLHCRSRRAENLRGHRDVNVCGPRERNLTCHQCGDKLPWCEFSIEVPSNSTAGSTPGRAMHFERGMQRPADLIGRRRKRSSAISPRLRSWPTIESCSMSPATCTD